MQRRAGAVLAALARRMAADGAPSSGELAPAAAAATSIAWSSPPPRQLRAASVARCSLTGSFATAAPAPMRAVAAAAAALPCSNSSLHLHHHHHHDAHGRPRTAPPPSGPPAPAEGETAAASFVDKDEPPAAEDDGDDNERADGSKVGASDDDDDADDFEFGGQGGGQGGNSGGIDPLTAALRAASLDDAARAALTPAEIVRRLDEDVVGQAAAKRAVAVALRNRWRRQRLPDAHRREVAPRGLLLVGPTGSGKTEIARRLARLGDAPFVATSATRYTELGYVGADVEDMVKELADEALRLTKRRVRDALRRGAEARAERAVVRALCGPRAPAATLAEFTRLYRAGALDELPVSAEALGGGAGGDGGEAADEQRQDYDDGGGDPPPPPPPPSSSSSSSRSPPPRPPSPPLPPPSPATAAGAGAGPTLRVADAREALLERDVARRLDASAPLLQREALRLASEEGIIFIDEIDKIVEPGAAQRAAAGREGGGGWATGGGGGGRGGGVSSEGVQRDLLPILEGTVVPTKLGPLDTTHVLFVCAGAFHQARPSDMLGELQGRLPVRVELARMSRGDLLRVLCEPRHSLLKQHQALLRAEGVDLSFSGAALGAVARCAAEANRLLDDLGARRLGTVLERVLRGVSYDAPAMVAAARKARRREAEGSGAEAEAAGGARPHQDDGDEPLVPYVIEEADVERAMAEVLAVPDLSRHML